ncbi:basic proline-rich protein-like [Cervus canadensis]|uniref:basic proline-rich protein-like n=1 Tax=Cervus canadensis TaxID=1574408 RepID=UPI001CA30800|nr:basic proline-rich protein-like [Cervus canadensis]
MNEGCTGSDQEQRLPAAAGLTARESPRTQPTGGVALSLCGDREPRSVGASPPTAQPSRKTPRPTPTSSRFPSSDPSASQDPLSPRGSSAWPCRAEGLREKLRLTVTPGRGEEGANLDAPPLPASNGQHRPELPRPGVEPRFAPPSAPPRATPSATLSGLPRAPPLTLPRPAPRPGATPRAPLPPPPACPTTRLWLRVPYLPLLAVPVLTLRQKGALSAPSTLFFLPPWPSCTPVLRIDQQGVMEKNESGECSGPAPPALGPDLALHPTGPCPGPTPPRALLWPRAPLALSRPPHPAEGGLPWPRAPLGPTLAPRPPDLSREPRETPATVTREGPCADPSRLPRGKGRVGSS